MRKSEQVVVERLLDKASSKRVYIDPSGNTACSVIAYTTCDHDVDIMLVRSDGAL